MNRFLATERFGMPTIWTFNSVLLFDLHSFADNPQLGQWTSFVERTCMGNLHRSLNVVSQRLL